MTKAPLQLFIEFISALSTSDDLPASEVSQYAQAVQLLCQRSPTVAQFFLKQISDNLDVSEKGSEESEHHEVPRLPRKQRRVLDRTYKPPRPVKRKEEAIATEGSDGVSDRGSEHSPMDIPATQSDAADETPEERSSVLEADCGLAERSEDRPDPASAEDPTLPSTDVGGTNTAVGELMSASETHQEASTPDAPEADEAPPDTQMPIRRYTRSYAWASHVDSASQPLQPKGLDEAENGQSSATLECVSPRGGQHGAVAPQNGGENPEIEMMHGGIECYAQARCESPDGGPEVTASYGMSYSNGGGPSPVPLLTSGDNQLVEPEVPSSSEARQTSGGISPPSTPKPKMVDDDRPSPPTEEIPRLAGSASHIPLLESPSPSPTLDKHSSDNFFDEMLDVVESLSHSGDQVPKTAHPAILRDLELGVNTVEGAELAKTDPAWTMDSKDWSGSMWLRYLDAGESRSQKAVVFNLIGYMGFAAWYAAQLAAFDAPVTERGKPRKRKSPYLLDYLVFEASSEEQPSKRRRLAIDHTRDSLAARQSGASSKPLDRKRRAISKKVFYGETLRRMVPEVGLWILLRRDIW